MKDYNEFERKFAGMVDTAFMGAWEYNFDKHMFFYEGDIMSQHSQPCYTASGLLNAARDCIVNDSSWRDKLSKFENVPLINFIFKERFDNIYANCYTYDKSYSTLINDIQNEKVYYDYFKIVDNGEGIGFILTPNDGHNVDNDIAYTYYYELVDTDGNLIQRGGLGDAEYYLSANQTVYVKFESINGNIMEGEGHFGMYPQTLTRISKDEYPKQK